MGCSKLIRSAYKNSMETIREQSLQIYNTYARSFVNGGIKELREGWKSTKGYNKVNSLGIEVTKALEDFEKRVTIAYDTMKDGASEYVRQQIMAPILLQPMMKGNYDFDKKNYSENSDIEIDDDLISDGLSSIEKWKKETFELIENMKEVTSSNDKFGYWSDHGDIVGSLNRTLSNLKDNLNEACESCFSTFTNDIEEDRAKQSAHIQNLASSLSSGN